MEGQNDLEGIVSEVKAGQEGGGGAPSSGSAQVTYGLPGRKHILGEEETAVAVAVQTQHARKIMQKRRESYEAYSSSILIPYEDIIAAMDMRTGLLSDEGKKMLADRIPPLKLLPQNATLEQRIEGISRKAAEDARRRDRDRRNNHRNNGNNFNNRARDNDRNRHR